MQKLYRIAVLLILPIQCYSAGLENFQPIQKIFDLLNLRLNLPSGYLSYELGRRNLVYPEGHVLGTKEDLQILLKDKNYIGKISHPIFMIVHQKIPELSGKPIFDIETAEEYILPPNMKLSNATRHSLGTYPSISFDAVNNEGNVFKSVVISINLKTGDAISITMQTPRYEHTASTNEIWNSLLNRSMALFITNTLTK